MDSTIKYKEIEYVVGASIFLKNVIEAYGMTRVITAYGKKSRPQNISRAESKTYPLEGRAPQRRSDTRIRSRHILYL